MQAERLRVSRGSVATAVRLSLRLSDSTSLSYMYASLSPFFFFSLRSFLRFFTFNIVIFNYPGPAAIDICSETASRIQPGRSGAKWDSEGQYETEGLVYRWDKMGHNEII